MSDEDFQSIRDVTGVDNLVHHPTRLAILLFLMTHPVVTFPEIGTSLELTAGNLSSHMTKLADAELIITEKKFVNQKPTTLLSITNLGRQAVDQYAETLRRALKSI